MGVIRELSYNATLSDMVSPFEPGEVGELTAKLEEVCQNFVRIDSERFARIRTELFSRYEWHAVAMKHERVYRRVCK